MRWGLFIPAQSFPHALQAVGGTESPQALPNAAYQVSASQGGLLQVFKPAVPFSAACLLASPWLPAWLDVGLPIATILTCMSQQFHAWAHMKGSQLPGSVQALQVCPDLALGFASEPSMCQKQPLRARCDLEPHQWGFCCCFHVCEAPHRRLLLDGSECGSARELCGAWANTVIGRLWCM